MPLGYLNSGERTGSCLRCKKVYATKSTSRKYCSVQCRLEYDPRARLASHVKHKYKITVDEYERRLSEADGKCAICRREIPKAPEGTSPKKRGMVYSLHLDHDHETGIVRGFLCSSCNKGLGHFRDSVTIVRAALLYLEKFK